MTDPKPDPKADLAEACIAEAMAIVAAEGPERLSLREVARRLGVSHQAPYRHYPTRDHLLAEMIARAFADFTAHLAAAERSGEPYADLGAMGRAYLAYALEKPLHYRLMFGTHLDHPEEHPEKLARAREAFGHLRAAIARLGTGAEPDLDALFVWATMHGLAGILRSGIGEALGLAAGAATAAAPHALGRIGRALGKPGP